MFCVRERCREERQAPDVLEIPPPGENGLCCIVHETDDAALLASMHPRDASRRDGRCQRGERPYLDSKQDAAMGKCSPPRAYARGKERKNHPSAERPFFRIVPNTVEVSLSANVNFGCLDGT